ncbi:hypothetical protein [Mycolicibacterium hippocampi]|uniref:Uncharacterized protein n=1 Tax=Mycolicibacterium hippocampi TaxID=659824 RepID=A0A7I9ZLB2_9MYCO|nr:hypothetical protein [Mycolicibacterium hippocampi]GFH01831.1 hypothetical protein MHIP_23140 [Mycolicibacterium hippocampi]
MSESPTALRSPGSGSLTARVAAWTFANRFDEQLSLGFTGKAGTALALHADRLRSRRERQSIARSLHRAVVGAHDRRWWLSPRLPLHHHNIRNAEDTVRLIVDRLQSPSPVTAVGMARLRRVLTDGAGPFYLCGNGDLDGRLRAALSAL